MAKRILVIDDDEDVRSMTCRFLEHAGFSVVCASSVLKGAQEFFRALDTEPFDGALVDLSMPEKDGSVFINIVRAWEDHNADNRTRIVVFTAYDEVVKDSTLIERADIDAYLRKDVDVEEVAAVFLSPLAAVSHVAAPAVVTNGSADQFGRIEATGLDTQTRVKKIESTIVDRDIEITRLGVEGRARDVRDKERIGDYSPRLKAGASKAKPKLTNP